MICSKCNFFNDLNATVCIKCGNKLVEKPEQKESENSVIVESEPAIIKNEINDEASIKKEVISNKSWGVTLILCILLGVIGFHRFYVGKAGTAILMLLTLGGFGIWVLVDLVAIIIHQFTDEDGRKIKRTRKVKEQLA